MTILKKRSNPNCFLDIQMPEIKGTDFAKLICTRLRFIFYYYSEYALEGFELNAIDYLLNQLFSALYKLFKKIKMNNHT
jgi:two-component SAPR family response regulator